MLEKWAMHWMDTERNEYAYAENPKMHILVTIKMYMKG